MKNTLCCLVSDGAKVFSADVNSVGAKLSNWINRKKESLFRIWCYAHKLQVCLGKSYQTFEIISEINDFMTDLSTYYFGHSYKRQAHLNELAITLNERMYKINNIFKIRFIGSSFTAVKGVIKSYFFQFNVTL